MKVTKERKEAMRARLAAATPGPWNAMEAEDEEIAHFIIPRASSGVICIGPIAELLAKGERSYPESEANAVFIANAREDLGDVLDDLDELTKTIKEANDNAPVALTNALESLARVVNERDAAYKDLRACAEAEEHFLKMAATHVTELEQKYLTSEQVRTALVARVVELEEYEQTLINGANAVGEQNTKLLADLSAANLRALQFQSQTMGAWMCNTIEQLKMWKKGDDGPGAIAKVVARETLLQAAEAVIEADVTMHTEESRNPEHWKVNEANKKRHAALDVYLTLKKAT